jgi:hypothetical protein
MRFRNSNGGVAAAVTWAGIVIAARMPDGLFPDAESPFTRTFIAGRCPKQRDRSFSQLARKHIASNLADDSDRHNYVDSDLALSAISTQYPCVLESPAALLETAARLHIALPENDSNGSVAHLSCEWNEGEDGIAGHAGQ